MHFYTKDAKPAHYQPNKSRPGFTRPTTVADAKKLDLVPSVTTILKVIDKPALVRWLQEQPLKYLYENADEFVGERPDGVGVCCNPSPDGFARDVIKASTEARSQETADRGTLIHEYIERHFKGLPALSTEQAEYAKAVVDHLEHKQGIWPEKWVASSEEYFVSPDGYGGCIDLVLRHKEGSGVVILDFKSKEWDTGAAKLKRLHYEENCEQLAAYAHGIGEPGAACINVYLHRDTPVVRSHEWTAEDIKFGYQVFKGAQAIWCGRKRFAP